MNILFIGGTGRISTAISKAILADEKHTLYLINRGNRTPKGLEKAIQIQGDINDEASIAKKLEGLSFDAVADFIAFEPASLERDYRLFKGKTKQFVFISSASAYQKPPAHYEITESTPLVNPYWEYSRQKIAGEEYLMDLYRKEGFPITIVRPSHTYDERSVAVGVHGNKGSWQIVDRMLKGKPVIVHGDGASLWTMTHNSDFAKGFIGLLGNIHAIGESVHITSDESLTWNQIYGTLASALGVEYKPYYVPSDFLAAVSDYDLYGGLLGDKANSVVFDNSKLKRLVPGFVATKRVDQGIAETVKYILAHEECQTKDEEFDQWCDSVIEALEEAKKKLQKV
ncbi:hypothetical protein FACS1894111_11160 [Clostridia bacterium]|nr:hypothetical protein FACS1894111_11160 [Clostridia bacterium]